MFCRWKQVVLLVETSCFVDGDKMLPRYILYRVAHSVFYVSSARNCNSVLYISASREAKRRRRFLAPFRFFALHGYVASSYMMAHLAHEPFLSKLTCARRTAIYANTLKSSGDAAYRVSTGKNSWNYYTCLMREMARQFDRGRVTPRLL